MGLGRDTFRDTTLEEKFRISARPCNILYFSLYVTILEYKLSDRLIQAVAKTSSILRETVGVTRSNSVLYSIKSARSLDLKNEPIFTPPPPLPPKKKNGVLGYFFNIETKSQSACCMLLEMENRRLVVKVLEP